MRQANIVSEIETDPESGARECEVLIAPRGFKAIATILPSASGHYLPYANGDTVLVSIAQGTAEAGVYIQALFERSPAPEDPRNLEWHAKPGASIRLVTDANGKVRLGRQDGDYEAIALHADLSTQVADLRRMVDFLVGLLNTSVNGGGLIAPVGTSPAGAYTAAMLALIPGYVPGLGTVPPASLVTDGGKPAANVEAQPSP